MLTISEHPIKKDIELAGVFGRGKHLRLICSITLYPTYTDTCFQIFDHHKLVEQVETLQEAIKFYNERS